MALGSDTIVNCNKLFYAVFLSRLSQSLSLVALFVVLRLLQEEGVQLSSIKGDDWCSSFNAKQFQETRLPAVAEKTMCVQGPSECYQACVEMPACRSFAAAKLDECAGSSQCLLYSEVFGPSDFIKDTRYAYYIMETSNCSPPCTNGRPCNRATCKCQKPAGYEEGKSVCRRSVLWSKCMTV